MQDLGYELRRIPKRRSSQNFSLRTPVNIRIAPVYALEADARLGTRARYDETPEERRRP
jgi:hypothetical protein